jgi:hypothetical protein
MNRMVAKNDIATTARPPQTMSSIRPADDHMADFSLVVRAVDAVPRPLLRTDSTHWHWP